MEPVRSEIVGEPTDDGPRSDAEPPILALRFPKPVQLPIDYSVGEFDPVDFAVQHLRAIYSKDAADALFANRPVEKIYSAPRRFDIATTFAVSTAFAMLFTILGYCEFSVEAKLAWCVYFFGVGFAQAAMFGGRAPRTASVIAGSVLLTLLLFGFVIGHGSIVLCALFGALILGMPGGYLAGTIIGGVFLVADKLRNRIGK